MVPGGELPNLTESLSPRFYLTLSSQKIMVLGKKIMMGQSLLTFVVLAGVCFNIASAVAGATTGAPGELRCQEDDGTMLPVATVCDDDLSAATCSAVFGAQVAPGATSRSPNCDNDELQETAFQCARTCGICCEKPEYDCEDSRCKQICFDFKFINTF